MGLLDGGVALVTGAGSGIGRASAKAFVREGADGVVVADVDVDGGRATVTEIEADGGTAIFVECDVAREADVERMVRATIDTFGRLDYAHNNAGIGPRLSPIAEVTEADWDRLIGINLKGVFLCMKHEIAVMLEAGSGAVVNTASLAGLGGFPMMTVYSAAKHGVVGLTKAAALECSELGVRVNAICPGGVLTPMQQKVADDRSALQGTTRNDEVGLPRPNWGQMRRWSEANEQAEVAVWLCSDRASYVTGAALAVDGGASAQ